MQKKTKRLFWIVPLILLIAASIVVYYQWNKPHSKVEDLDATVAKAETVYQDFVSNEAHADSIYLNKVLQIQGTVAEVSKNQDGKTVFLLSVSDPMGGIQCTMRDGGDVKNGSTVTVKGFCNGYTMVVILDDCILVN